MSDRKYYLDYLRVISIIGVVMMHVAGHCIGDVTTSMSWQIYNIFDSGTRWAVPIFVMISGSLFLDRGRDVDVKKIYKKYILRLIEAYLFWSLVYTLVFSTFRYYSSLSFAALRNTIVGMVQGGMYHFWYIFMLIGLYMLTPLLRIFLEHISGSLLSYLMVLLFAFDFCIPALREFSTIDFLLGENIDNILLGFPTGGYLFYYILGHLLDTMQLSKNMRKFCYLLGIFGLIFTLTVTGIGSYLSGSEEIYFRDNFSPNVVFMSIAIFVYFKERTSEIIERKRQDKRKNFKILLRLSKYSFGIYLVHELVLTNVDALGVLICSPVICEIVLFCITFFVSLIITYLIDNIKCMRNYII